MAKDFITLAKMAVISLWLSVCGNWVHAQPRQAAGSEFEVASVRQNISESDNSEIKDSIPGRFIVSNTPLIFLILYAYDLKAYELIGAPEWTRDKSYNVVGKYPGEEKPSLPEIRAMVQHLLVERFGLKIHSEPRDIPAYDLVLARKDGRLGPQLQKSNLDCDKYISDRHPPSGVDASRPSPVSPTGKRPKCTITATRRYITGGAQTLAQLAGPLGVMVSRPVVNKTGLKAAYDFDLKWDALGLAVEPAGSQPPSEEPSIFEALKEQLGLKLVPHDEKFDVYVVDQIGPPDAN